MEAARAARCAAKAAELAALQRAVAEAEGARSREGALLETARAQLAAATEALAAVVGTNGELHLAAHVRTRRHVVV